jgi:nicotinamidase-related amidase
LEDYTPSKGSDQIFEGALSMSLTLDPKTTALVLIDLQKGILSRPLEPHSGQQVIENAAAIGARCNDIGAVVVLVNVAFSSGFADVLKQPVDSPMPRPPGGMPPEFSEFVPEIGGLRGDVMITKRQWGAFHGTELDLQLRRRGVTTIVLGGVATNFGVESTAREAWQHNYALVIAEDACTCMSAEMHRFAVEKIFPRLGLVRSTAEILAAMQHRAG